MKNEASSANPALPPVESGAKPRPKPEGWWSMPGHDFEGSREGVLAAVKARSDIPARWRETIIGEINDLPAEFNQVTIDAHVSVHTSEDGKRHQRVYDLNVTGSIKL